MKKGEPKNYTNLWMLIAFGVAVGWLISTADYWKQSPRSKHGEDVISYKDTLYYLHFKIDSAVYNNPYEHDDPHPSPY